MSLVSFQTRTRLQARWTNQIPDEQWGVYGPALKTARERGIGFALAGGFAIAAHAGYWRNTKDLDLYVLPRDRGPLISILTELGLEDYYEKMPYDRWWSYRGHKDGIIIDLIWAMANRRAEVDELWIAGPQIELRGLEVSVAQAEDLLWDKLYILQRDRCDWPDLLNLLFSVGVEMDWQYLLGRVGEDWPILAGLLMLFRWLAPQRAQGLLPWIWERLRLSPPSGDLTGEDIERRPSLLNIHPWFGPDRQVKPAA